jgi:hypothetical protein
MKQTGGVLAQEYQEYQKSHGIDAITPFIWMLQSGTMGITDGNTNQSTVVNLGDTVTLTALSSESLFGFVFKLTLSGELHYPYVTMNNMPIHDFIIKLVGVSTTQEKDRLPGFTLVTHPGAVGGYKNLHKELVTQANFNAEAALQEYVWKESVSYGRPELCPSVEYAGIIDSDEKINILLSKFVYHLPSNSVENSIMTYLNNIIYDRKTNSRYPNRRLGVVLMPAVPNAQTFYSFIRPNKRNAPYVTAAVIDDVVANIIAQIVRLFVWLKVIHLDLHSNNVLVYYETEVLSRQYKSTIIDFGIASRINPPISDIYFLQAQKKVMDIEINAFNISFYNIVGDESKIAFMRNVINCINYYDARVYYNKQVRNVSMLTDDNGKKYLDETDKDGTVHRVFYYDGDHATKSRPTITKIIKPEFSTTYELHQLQWIDKYIKNDSIMTSAFDKLRGMVDIKRAPDESDKPDKPANPAKRARRGGKTKRCKKSRKCKKSRRHKKTKTA